MSGPWRRLALGAEALWARLRVRGAERRLHTTAVNRAVERVVDQADPRLRGLMGYRKALFPVVEVALAQAEALAAQIPGPVRIDRGTWSSDPLVNALFGDLDALRRVLSGPAVRAWVKGHPEEAGDCCGILLAWPQARTQFGVELHGDTLRSDVQQTALAFVNPEVAVPAADPASVRRQAVQGVLDVFAGEAIRDLTEHQTRIAEIEERLRILRLKRKVLSPAGRGMDFLRDGSAAHLAEDDALGQRIEELEQQLAVVSEGLKTLDDHLDRLVEGLRNQQGRLSIRRERITLDRMNIVRATPDGAAGGGDAGVQEIELAVGYRGETRGRVLLLVQFPRSELITLEERLAEADQFLANG